MMNESCLAIHWFWMFRSSNSTYSWRNESSAFSPKMVQLSETQPSNGTSPSQQTKGVHIFEFQRRCYVDFTGCIVGPPDLWWWNTTFPSNPLWFSKERSPKIRAPSGQDANLGLVARWSQTGWARLVPAGQLILFGGMGIHWIPR
jgi:hypothetical protein